MNHLKPIKKLNNSYYAMRHGESQANVQKLIVSHLNNGIKEYGLTSFGINQAKKSAIANAKKLKNAVIYYSSFKRTKETAMEANKILKSRNTKSTKHLWERNFGLYEKKTKL